MTILVAEDEAVIRRFVVRVLTARGHRCVEATSEAEFESLIRAERPDVVVSDIGLGPGDGLAACLRLRAERPALPILLMTGDPQNARRASASGLGPALLKPFLPREFEAALDAIGV